MQFSKLREHRIRVSTLKRRVEQLLNEKFEYEVPLLSLSESEIHLVLRKGETFRGSFQIENTAQKKVKGFLYSSSARVAYEPERFSAIRERISYDIDTRGMEEGDAVDGFFTICTNIGEYRLPYHIEIEVPKVRTSTEVIESIDALNILAAKDFQKAYLLFISPLMRQMIETKYPEYVTLYDGILAVSPSYRSLEEFLIGAGMKKPVSVKLGTETAAYGKVQETMRETVTLTKNNWGFLRLDISSDAPFLTVERPIVTTDEFIGSTYPLHYLIHPEKLHAGKNFGRITIKSDTQELHFEVCVKKGASEHRNIQVHAQRTEVAKIEECYIEYATGKISKQIWIRKSGEALDNYYHAGGRNTMILLFQTQIMFEAERAEEAKLILDKLELHKEKLNTPEILGYYLYLTTFYNRDESYRARVEDNLESLFLQNQENWMLAYFLIHMKERYNKYPVEKLDAIRRQYIYGCRSRIMYLEAFRLIEGAPLLLKKLEDFELQVLLFASRQGLLNPSLILQTAELSGRYREYSETLYKILQSAYEVNPVKDVTAAICTQLIRGKKAGEEYLKWYALGVEQGLRITKLYEFYVASLNAKSTVTLPQIIRKYFAYNNTLSYKKKAMVYANVIRNRERDPQTYQAYRPAMEQFMVDQLSVGRVNQDIALIYKTFLVKAMLNKRMADNLARCLFTYEITCDAKKITGVVVLHKQLKHEQFVTLVNGKAQIQLYTDDYRILLTDAQGNRYAESIPYRLERILEEPAFVRYCEAIVPQNPEMLVHKCEDDVEITPENVRDFMTLVQLEEIRENYRESLRKALLAYFYSHCKDEALGEFLEKIDYGRYVRIDKKMLIELLTSEGLYEDAFELVSIYGPEKTNVAALVRVCSRMIFKMEYQEDEMLTSVCAYCFVNEKYDEHVLLYLLRYYDGPIETMKAVWNAGKAFGLNTFDLEEKILLIAVYTGSGMRGTEKVFDSYKKQLGKEKILHAYAMYMAYRYFVKENALPVEVAQDIESGLLEGRYTEEICRLTMLRWYAESEKLSESQQTFLQELLEHYVHKGIYFAFYRNLDDGLKRAFQLQDKTYIEHRMNPAGSARVYYRVERPDGKETKETVESMLQVYQGIFVKVFTLFCGETLKYHVVEEVNGKSTEGDDLEIVWEDNRVSKAVSGYDLINEMQSALMNDNKAEAKASAERYLRQYALAEKLFTLC